MPDVVIHHEDCPICQSEDVASYWWQRGQAWIIICGNCKHEAGRESEEHRAWQMWDEEARDAREDHLKAQGAQQ